MESKRAELIAIGRVEMHQQLHVEWRICNKKGLQKRHSVTFALEATGDKCPPCKHSHNARRHTASRRQELLGSKDNKSKTESSRKEGCVVGRGEC